MPRLQRDKLASLVEHSLEILDNKLLRSTHQKYGDEDDNGDDPNTCRNETSLLVSWGDGNAV